MVRFHFRLPDGRITFFDLTNPGGQRQVQHYQIAFKTRCSPDFDYCGAHRISFFPGAAAPPPGTAPLPPDHEIPDHADIFVVPPDAPAAGGAPGPNPTPRGDDPPPHA